MRIGFTRSCSRLGSLWNPFPSGSARCLALSVTVRLGPSRYRSASLSLGFRLDAFSLRWGWVRLHAGSLLAPLRLGLFHIRCRPGSIRFGRRPLRFRMGAGSFRSRPLLVRASSCSAAVHLAPIRHHFTLTSTVVCATSFSPWFGSVSATLGRGPDRFGSVSVRFDLGWLPFRFRLAPDGECSVPSRFVLVPSGVGPGACCAWSGSGKLCITRLRRRLNSLWARSRSCFASLRLAMEANRSQNGSASVRCGFRSARSRSFTVSVRFASARCRSVFFSLRPWLGSFAVRLGVASILVGRVCNGHHSTLVLVSFRLDSLAVRFGAASAILGRGPVRAASVSVRFGFGAMPYRCLLAPLRLGSLASRFASGSASAPSFPLSLPARFDPTRLPSASLSFMLWLGSLSVRVSLAPVRHHFAVISVAACLDSLPIRLKPFSASLDCGRVRVGSVWLRYGLGWVPSLNHPHSAWTEFASASVRSRSGSFPLKSLSGSVLFGIAPLLPPFDSV